MFDITPKNTNLLFYPTVKSELLGFMNTNESEANVTMIDHNEIDIDELKTHPKWKVH